MTTWGGSSLCATPNIWSDEWEFESDEEWAAGRSTRLPRGEKLGATVYEVVEYPDTRQLSAMAFTESQLGRPLWDIRTLDEPETSQRLTGARLVILRHRADVRDAADLHLGPAQLRGHAGDRTRRSR